MKLNKFIFGLILTFSFLKIKAGYHAGEITYNWLYGYTYQIKLTTFTDIGNANYYDPCEDTLCFGDGTSTVLLRVNGPIAGCAPAHQGVPINPNINLNEYVTTHTYPGPGNYTICFNQPNRNIGINNIPNSVNQTFSLESFLVIPVFGSGQNSSSVFGNLPLDYGCMTNSCYNYNPTATDIDGDSLSYDIFICQNAGSTFPASGPSGTFSINPISGLLSWCNPQLSGDYNIRIKINEWRKDIDGNYFIVGYVIRDTQFNMSTCMGIDEENQPEKNITVFPNPTNNITTIHFTKKENYTIELYDIRGNVLISETHTNSNYILNLENILQGIYILKIKGNNNTSITKKIIKQ